MGMARTYRLLDREQEFLLAPSMLDWLPADHLVWFVLAAVQRLDTAAFHTRAKLGGVGRRGYDPDMLLALFVYAMAHGESSSRRIERLCHTDVAFRIICAQDVPDHTVLARFRQRHQDALTGLLTESLVLAAELGMVSLGVVAFDGTKIAANASKDANRSEAHLQKLAEKFVSTVAETDAAEDVLFGEDNRGDEPPPGMGDRSGREERISRALEQIAGRRAAAERAVSEQSAQDAKAAEGYLQAVADGVARVGRPPRGADPVEVAKARWEREHRKAAARAEQREARAAQARACGRASRTGTPPVPVEEYCRVRAARVAYDKARAAAHAAHAAPAAPAPGDHTESTGEPERANVTDPESRLLKTRNGWIQGYNCQTAVSDDSFILAARATQDANDVEQFVATVDALATTAQTLAERTGRQDLVVGTMIGDAGYDSNSNLTAEGPDRLIADAKSHEIDQRSAHDPATGDPPADASPRQKMNHRLRTPEGHDLYQRRAPMIEAPNAWLKDGRGLRQFDRRGLHAVQAELSFASAVTNLLKLRVKGITTTGLQTA